MASQRHLRVASDRNAVLAGLDVATLWGRMLEEFLREWERLDRQGLGAVEVERQMQAFLEGLSEKPIEDLARKTSTAAYNEGRGAELATQADAGAVRQVVRSEILDARTCRTCEILDGTVVDVRSPEFREYMPPAKCEGGDRCRGFYIGVAS